MQSTVDVVATTAEGTRAALATAVPLSKGSGARLTVIVPHIVSCPVEVGELADSTEFFVRHYRDLVTELGGEARIEVCLCRRLDELVARLAAAGSIIVVGGPTGRWITSPEERFANRLSRLGARVIFVASGANTTQRRIGPSAAAMFAALLLVAPAARAQATPPPAAPAPWQYGGFIDVAGLYASQSPPNHLFRNRGTTPRVNEIDLNMAAAYVRKSASDSSPLGFEATAQTGEDAKIFGFSATAPNIGGADTLRHFGPTSVSYLAKVGNGLTLQGGIFSSLIGYDSLYAKDNFNYTRPWTGDYTPYLMLGANAAYPVSPTVTLTGFIVNGYWHLAHANDAPSIGGQLAYKPSDRVTVKETILSGSHQVDTSLGRWRFFSDTIVERKSDRVTTAFEYQIGTERVSAAGARRALWMAAQLLVHWRVQGPWSLTARPEFAWDRDGRWIGGEQSVKALTTTLEYRVPLRGAQVIVRGEHRVDDSRGPAGGFFDEVGLTPTQQLVGIALILTFDGVVQR
jgi:hypothetical protein